MRGLLGKPAGLRSAATLLLAALLAVPCACVEPAGDDDDVDDDDTNGPTPAPDDDDDTSDAVQVSLAAPCESPGTGLLRLQSRAVERGLDHVDPGDPTPHSCLYVPGGVVAADLDADGDVDLLFSRADGFPHLYEHGADGQFNLGGGDGVAASTVDLWGRMTLAQAAVDLDGDQLPEVLLVGEGFAAVARNLGGLQFAEPELLLFEAIYPVACYQSVAVGDVDGDGDLDLALPGLDPVAEAGALPEAAVPDSGTWDRLLLQDGGGAFHDVAELGHGAGGQPWLSMLAAFTDRDGDGDLDLFFASDRARDGRPGAAFWRNDGSDDGDDDDDDDDDGVPVPPTLVDDAPALHADAHACAMGLATADFNGDERPDYCISDLLPELRCLLSQPDGSYAEAGAALGLLSHIDEHPDIDSVNASQWSPWSAEAIDLDNDGYVDLAAAAGPPPGPGGVAASSLPRPQPDALFQGGPATTGDGLLFSDVTWEAGFGDAAAHYGMAWADLDRDGAVELILGAWDGPVVLWDNPCTEGAWVTVELNGVAGNRQGFGATVELVADGQRRSQELHSLRTVGQSEAALHFGLGEASEVESLRVRWPDGAETTASALPVRARLRVSHPDAGGD